MMNENIIYYIVAYSIVVFFIVIGVLTILTTFFSDALAKKGLKVSSKIQKILFTKLILEVVAIGFLIYHKGPIIPEKPIVVPGHMNANVYRLYNNAFKQFALGNYQAAIENFTNAIELDPENYLLYLNRSVVYLTGNKKVEAEEDFRKGMELYENLSDQQKRREQWYKLLIVNQGIALYGEIEDCEAAFNLYTENIDNINNMADAIMRIYTNIGNAYLENNRWSEAAETCKKAMTIAQSLENHEMQILAGTNVAVATYWIAGQENISLKYAEESVELLNIYNLPIEKEAGLLANALNSRGLIKYKLHIENGEFTKSEIIQDYSDGINSLQEINDRTDAQTIILSNLYANRADVYLNLDSIDLAVRDYKTSINRMINRSYFDGISRQLVGFSNVLKKRDSYDWREIYSLLYLANKIGRNKPAIQISDDQQLLANATQHLSDAEISEVKKNIHEYLERATEIPGNTWRQYL